MMRIILHGIAFTLILGLPHFAFATEASIPSLPSISVVVLDQIQSVLRGEEEAHSKIDLNLTKRIDEFTAQSVSPNNKNLDETITDLQSKISDTENDLIENHLRIDFLNALISSLQSINITDLRKDLCQVLKQSAHRQLLSGAESTSTDSKTWIFELNLCLAIKDIMEPGEKLGEFIKKYMIYSSLREPRSPTEFLKSRDYISN